MKVFYHTDLDGHCAGAVVYKFNGGRGEYIPINYGQESKFNLVKKDENVVIVDWNFDDDEKFLDLKGITKNIVIIDHHQNSLKLLYNDIKGIRNANKSGCELAWDYFYPDVSTPRAVKLIGDYDTWKFIYGDETRKFLEGIKCYGNDPSSWIWNDLLLNPNLTTSSYVNSFIKRIEKKGEIIIQYLDYLYPEIIEQISFKTKFEGYSCIACNAIFTGSKIFDSLKEQYDIKIIFNYDGKMFNVSLYSEKVNVFNIATKFGGGGHKKASGFQCEKLPF